MKTPPVADAADGVLQSSVRKSERLKVGRRHLAAPVDLQLEAEALTLVQALQPGPLDRRDMDECIGLAVIALNEAETLHRVEELHRALDALASGLALMATRGATAITIAVMETNVPVWALDAAAVEGGLRLRAAEPGESVPRGRLVVACGT